PCVGGRVVYLYIRGDRVKTSAHDVELAVEQVPAVVALGDGHVGSPRDGVGGGVVLLEDHLVGQVGSSLAPTSQVDRVVRHKLRGDVATCHAQVGGGVGPGVSHRVVHPDVVVGHDGRQELQPAEHIQLVVVHRRATRQ